MIHKSYVMHFRAHDVGDMQKLDILCAMLRSKGTCFSITDIILRGKKGYEVFWYIKNQKMLTRFNKADRRQH
jgi:hypothetical protein